MLISIKSPDQITSPPMHEDNCFTKYPCLGCLACCACCISCPLVCLGCCVFGWVLRCCPCSLRCMNCACSCLCPGTLIVNARLARDVMRHMEQNGGEAGFRVDNRLRGLEGMVAAASAVPAQATASDGSHSSAPMATHVIPISQTRTSGMV